MNQRLWPQRLALPGFLINPFTCHITCCCKLPAQPPCAISVLVVLLNQIGKLAPLQTSHSSNSALHSAVPVVTAKRVTREGGDSFGMSVDSIADAETDLNKLSVEELNGIKVGTQMPHVCTLAGILVGRMIATGLHGKEKDAAG